MKKVISLLLVVTLLTAMLAVSVNALSVSDVDDEGALAQRFGIMSIPTLILFKGGEAVHTMVGSVPKATLVAELEAHI